MATVLLTISVVVVVAAVVLGVVILLFGGDSGLSTADPDERSRTMDTGQSLTEADFQMVSFDITLRGYRMQQVDDLLGRVAWDIGYKNELLEVLSSEVEALRAGQVEEADRLRAVWQSAVKVDATRGEEAAGDEHKSNLNRDDPAGAADSRMMG